MTFIHLLEFSLLSNSIDFIDVEVDFLTSDKKLSFPAFYQPYESS